jgi:hypothetical protein
MPFSSLVVIGQNARFKIKEEQYTRVAELSGLKFIKLGHREGASLNEHIISGFQSAHVNVRENSQTGQRTYNFNLSQLRDGTDCEGLRDLVFRPEPETNRLAGWLIDTPFNRKKLVYTYGRGEDWVIDDPSLGNDPKIIEEIISEAKKILESEKDKKKTEKVLDRISEENEKLAEENRKLKEMLEKKAEDAQILKRYKNGQISEKYKAEGKIGVSTNADVKIEG